MGLTGSRNESDIQVIKTKLMSVCATRFSTNLET